MNGIEAAGEIRRSMDIPVVYLTAYTDETILQQATITDAYAYLIKPVRDRELRASLEMAFDKHDSDLHLSHLNQVLRALRDGRRGPGTPGPDPRKRHGGAGEAPPRHRGRAD